MALDQIPPWLDVTPGLFVNAMHSGAQVGAELAGQGLHGRQIDLQADAQDKDFQLARQKQAAQESQFGQKLGVEMSESEADRALKERLAKSQQDYANKKFSTQTGLDEAALNLRGAQLDLQNKHEQFQEVAKQTAAKKTSDIASAASDFWKDVSDGMTSQEAITKNPQAGFDPAVRQHISQDAVAARQHQPGVKETVRMNRGRPQGSSITGDPDDPKFKEAMDKLNQKPGAGSLTEEKAREFLDRAGGDKDKARQLAKEAGYSF